jgi:hypothetical protein
LRLSHSRGLWREISTIRIKSCTTLTKRHNSHEPELTWQEKTDLSPEDDIEGGSEIYYFTDEDGNIHSREFLTEELIPDEGEVKRSPKREPSGKFQKLKPGAIDIISLVRPNEARQQVTLPAPKSVAPFLMSGYPAK